MVEYELTWHPRGVNGKLAKQSTQFFFFFFRFPCLYSSVQAKLVFSQSGWTQSKIYFKKTLCEIDHVDHMSIFALAQKKETSFII